MPGRAFIGLSDVRFAAPKQQTFGEEEMLEAIDAACELIEEECHRRVLSEETTQMHSGDRALRYGDGTEIFLADPDGRMATLPVTAVESITEDGTGLTVKRFPGTTSWTDGEIAVVYDARGRVRRASCSGGRLSWKPWAPGVGNIIATVTCGYDATEGISDVPSQLRKLASEMAWLIYREGGRTGIEQWSIDPGSVRFARLISPLMNRAKQLYGLRVNSPQTVEG